jgi:hypothetical protein
VEVGEQAVLADQAQMRRQARVARAVPEVAQALARMTLGELLDPGADGSEPEGELGVLGHHLRPRRDRQSSGVLEDLVLQEI